MAANVKPIPEGFHTVTPCLTLMTPEEMQEGAQAFMAKAGKP